MVYGCYCSPNVGIEVYERLITDLVKDVRRQRKSVMVAGDLNAKALEWGSPEGDARGAAALRRYGDGLDQRCGSSPIEPGRPTDVREIRAAIVDRCARRASSGRLRTGRCWRRKPSDGTGRSRSSSWSPAVREHPGGSRRDGR